MEFYKKKHSPNYRFRPRPQSFVIKAECSPEIKEEEKCVLELKPFAVAPHLIFDKVAVGTSKSLTLFLYNPAEVKQLVCIEKFPFEKGFQIPDVKFSVPSLEEISIEVTWSPAKFLCCRESALFKTSAGVRSQVYFHGISQTPPKKKKKWNKMAIQKNPEISKTIPESEVPVTFEDDKKENINFGYEKNMGFTTLGTSNFRQSRQVPLQPLDDLGESPIRRQTYTINSIFRKSCAASDIKNFCMPINQTLDKNILHEKSVDLIENSYSHADPKKLFKCDENHDVFPTVNENRKTFFIPSSNQEKSCEWSKNNKTQLTVANSNQQSRLNGSRFNYTETNEVFNDSLESSTSDLCNESVSEVQLCPVDFSSVIQTPQGNETYLRKNESFVFVLPSNSGTLNNFQEQKHPTIGTDSLSLNKPNKSTNSSESTFELPHPYSMQNRVTKPKKCKINTPKKKIRSLNLYKSSVGPSKNDKEKVTHWNPYASFNAYYDEYWKEKQESAFSNWLNFILTPTDDFGTDDLKVNSAAIWVESMKDAAPIRVPSKEELSLKTYTAVKQLNQLRRSACKLYQSEELSLVIKKIEKEVDSKKILFRKDRAVHADLGIKKDLLEMLLSYNPLWLRIGLETIYGEMISLQNNKDIVGLSRFIIHKFLSNPDINAKFAYPSVINYYKPGYEDYLKRFILKKFISIVYFLDVAKKVRLINHNPCLFCKHAKYKTSRSLLLTLSREFLSGEGDITKHLRYIGCVVQHEQMPLEEFDYAVRNIAVDLRCGLRLGRVVEILLQDWSIFKALRANTLNRLAKIHNNEVIFQALEKASIQIEDNIDPRDIVNGNREKTLSLLWQIIFKAQVSKCLNLELLKKENSYLKRSLQLNADVATFNALQNCCDESQNFELGFLNSKLYKENEVIQQLFQWCQNVCAHYGVKVLNFTTSFSDGRAICFILHHYHPNLLPQSKIHKETTFHYFEKQMEAAEEEDSSCVYGVMTPELKSRLMKNEKENIDIAFEKLQEIGQIPILSFPSHVRNKIPDEKVIITLMSYVNMRLMELSVEIRAARTILLAYRKWCLRRKQAKLLIQIAAAIQIQRFWRSYLVQKRKEKEKIAAVCIQRCWRMFSAQKELERLRHEKHMQYLNQKASIIQAAYRKFRASRYQQKHTQASILLQSHIRKWLQRKQYVVVRSSAIKIQQWWRARVIGKEIRSSFLIKKQLVILLQSCVRRLIAQKYFRRQRESAILLQRNIRRLIAQKRFSVMKSSVRYIENWWANILLGRKLHKKYNICRQAAMKIQAMWRMYLEKKHFLDLKKAVSVVINHRTGKKQRITYLKTRENVIKLQALFRRYKCQKEYCQKKKAVTIIQSAFRGYCMKKTFSEMKSSAIKIQKYYRGYRLMCYDMHQFSVMKIGFTRLQAHFRGYKIRKEILKKTKAAIRIQSIFRSYAARKKLLLLKQAVIKIQRFYRGYLLMCVEKKNFIAVKRGVVAFQASLRAYLARKKFLKQKRAAVTIQSIFRCYITKKKYLTLKSSAQKIQKYYRGYHLMLIEKQKYATQKSGFIRMQALFRTYKARKHFIVQRKAAIVIQSAFRGYIAKKEYFILKSSAIKIQKYYRDYCLMLSEKQKYIIQKTGFTKLQAQFRACKGRKEFRRKKMAAIKIQSVFRGYVTRQRYAVLKSAVIKIQKYYRGFKLMCLENEKYQLQKTGFTKMQALFRSYQARKHFVKQKRASVMIQKAFRSFIAEKKYFILKSSVIKIQRYFRGYQLTCLEKQKFCIQKNGFIKLQAQFRAYKGRKEFLQIKRATIRIQSVFRGYVMRKKYLLIKSAVLKIQKYYCGFKDMCSDKQKYLVMKVGFIQLQAYFRGFKARKDFFKKKKAAIGIQKTFRCYSARKRYLALKLSAIKIQRYYRGYHLMCLERQSFLTQKIGFTKLQAQFRAYRIMKDFRLQKSAAIEIQNSFRRYIVRKKYLALKSATIKIQKYYRGYQLMCSDKKKYLVMKTGFTKLQALCRGTIARNNLKNFHRSAIIIQSHYRKFIAMKHYQELKQKCIIIQRHYRGWQSARKCTNEYHKIRQHIIFIQAAVRCYLTRKRYFKMYMAAVKIQSFVRMWKCRKLYLEARRRIIFIQQFYHFKYMMKIRKRSCIQIQACWRRYRVRKELERLSGAALLIQRWWRKRALYSKSVVCRQWYLRLRENCQKFQIQARIYLHKRTNAAIKIQTSWRAYAVRRSVKDKKIIQLREKIKAAPAEEYNTLGSRTRRALKVLLTDMNVRNILKALQNLEVCTRLSAACCERLQESGGLTVILTMIQSCNRSVPHQEIIKLSTDILLNLAKYKRTQDSVWKEKGSLITILDLMNIYRLKGLHIFTKCTTLFWIFSQEKQKAEMLRQNTEFVDRVKRFYSLLLEKKMNAEKQKTAASTSFWRSHYHSRRETIEPDWVLGQRKMREFQDSFTAISSLMQSLGLKT